VKFSLVHPSRSRLARAETAITEWRSQASGGHELEHILSVDADDPDLPGYRELAARHGSRLEVHPNKSMVEALNRGARAADGEVMVAISDDFGCPPAWDLAIADAIGGRELAAVLVDDGVNARILTIPIMTRAFYRRLGYVYHPAYISLWADDDLTEVAKREGALVDARHLVFPHRHMFVARAEADETYARQNSNRSWWHGWRTYEKRKLEDFGGRPRSLDVRMKQLRVDFYYFARTRGSALKRLGLRRAG
jgi:glycosyltransferase involved in cell wall biosynthesis